MKSRLLFGVFLLLTVFFISTASVNAQALTGSKIIKTSGGDYASLAAAFTAINTNGVSGTVQLLIDENLTETGANLILTRNDLSATNNVVIKPNTGKTPTVTFNGCATTGNNALSGLTIDGTTCPGYVTIDGSNTTGGTTKDLTFILNDATNGRYAIKLNTNADNVTIKNLIIKSQAIITDVTSTVAIEAVGSSTTTGLVADNLTITNCQIGEATAPVLFLYGIDMSNVSGGATYSGGLVLTNNTIYASARGLNLLRMNKTGSTCTISGNTVSILSTNTQGFTHAGIYLENWQDVVNIFNNKFVTLKLNNNYTSAFTLYGIHTRSGQASSVVNIYNNFISDFYVSGTITANNIYGIEAGSSGSNAATHNIYYNTVYINNENYSSNTGTFACLHSASTTAALVNAKNNIFVNTINTATSYVIKVVTNTNLASSDYNDLYKSGALASIGYYTAAQADIAAWKTATSKDANSININPANPFGGSGQLKSLTDLHWVSKPASTFAGTPIAGITTDIDGATRNTTKPYMGADEGASLTSVKLDGNVIPTEFALEQNYPNPFNPSTVINYKLSSSTHVILRVYDILGKEVATLVNEFQQAGAYKASFSTLNSSLTSGIYLYRLQAGSFVEARKMILAK